MSALRTASQSDRDTPYRSSRRQGSAGFAAEVRSEWTKFRTVPAWVLAVVIATAAAIGLSVFLSSSAGQSCPTASCNGQAPPTGPGGGRITDSYYLVHKDLGETGSITARVTSLTYASPGSSVSGANGSEAGAIQPWAKAGIIITSSTAQGSRYAAVMVTADYGVRLQDDYTHDIAGPAASVSAASPEWLRLTRSGDAVTGYASSDDAHWTTVGTVTLRALPHTAETGLFVASPDSAVLHQANVATQAKASFDHIALQGAQIHAPWRGSLIGTGATKTTRTGYFEPGHEPRSGGFKESAGTFAITGSGDIGPYLPPSDALGNSLIGLIIALIAVFAVAALFVTAEYRRGLIRMTLSACPNRGRVLAAKVIVSAAIAFALGLVAAAIDLPLAEHLLRSHGYVPPWWRTGTGLLSGAGLRIAIGTGALFALSAALAVAVGTIVRRSAATITILIVAIVLPVVLMFTLPQAGAEWVQRYTPAAAFSLQSSIPRYQQVSCYPSKGCFALSAWAGFGVFALYTVIALAGAFFLLRNRDA